MTLKTLKFLLILAVVTGIFGSSAGADVLSVPLNHNATTSNTGGPVKELVGMKANLRVTLTGETVPSGNLTNFDLMKDHKFVRNGTIGWIQGDPLTLDTAIVTDTGRPRLRRISASADTNLALGARAPNIVAFGRGVCDTGRYCVVTWEGTETGVLAGAAWLHGDLLAPSPDAFGLIPVRLVDNFYDTGLLAQASRTPVRALSACAAGSRCSVS